MFVPFQIQSQIGIVPLCPEAVVILFSGRSALFIRRGKQIAFPAGTEISTLGLCEKFYHLGTVDGHPCFANEVPAFPEKLPAPWFIAPARIALDDLPGEYWSALGRAREMILWRKAHRYCGKCGEVLTLSDTDEALFCPKCGSRYYPQIAPAVIVAVTRNGGREILLAHNKNFSGNIHGLIAGFVETGECVEECVRREVREESGLELGAIRYVSSQVWPFPNSLMLAFEAEYRSGIPKPDGGEIVSLGWYTKENHPELPAHGSIARRLIGRLWQEKEA